MTPDEFEAIIHDAILAVPAHIRKRMENVAFVVGQTPTGRPKHLLGLYQGIPLVHRGAGYSGVLPDKITIFQDALEEQANGDERELRRMIRDTVWHEIGHYFGFSEQKVRQWESHRRRSTKSK